MPYAKETNREKLGCLQTDCRKKFINMTLKDFYKERSIIIGYTSLYIHKENRIAEQC